MILQNKKLCTAVAVFTATAMLVPSVGFTKAKKASLSAKKLSLTVGEKKTLKVKNAKKKAKWSSNKKKVATVSKKGVVTAKKVGKATITAKIGKIKLNCKVTVKAKNNKKSTTTATDKPVSTATQIASVTVLNDSIISVVLSKAQQLTPSSFKVMAKKYVSGTYNKTYEIDSVSTSDGKTYTIVVGDEESISAGYFVNVTITGLAGNNGEVSKETVYNGRAKENKDSETVTCVVGESVESVFDVPGGNGFVKVAKVGAPAGISYKVKSYEYGDEIVFTGKCTNAGTFDYDIECVDELGNKYITTYKWIVGSSDTLVGYVEDTHMYLDVNDDNTENDYNYSWVKVHVAGGSGNYSYELVDNAKGIVTIDEDYYSDDESGSTALMIRNTTAGNKTYSLKVTDIENPTKSVTIKGNIIVKELSTVTGDLADAKGAKLNQFYKEICFVDVDEYDYYYAKIKDSKYSISLPDGLYNVYLCSESIDSDDEDDDYIRTLVGRNIKVTKSDKYNFKLKK